MSENVSDPQVFISYAREDDEAFVKQLFEDLSAHGIPVWWDRKAMASRGRTFLQELRDAIENVERVIFVVGPKAVESEYCRVELEHALLFGKGVLPILRQGSYDLVPAELAKLDCPDFRASRSQTEAIGELLEKLAESVAPLGPLRNLVPALPAHFLPRREELARLSHMVLADVHRPTVITSATQIVGLQGMGGIGKTVLAAAFARSTETRRALPDGIVWVTVGQGADTHPLIRQVGLAFDDDPVHYATKEAARAALPDLLANKVCLIVLDDVWDIRTVGPLRDALGVRCRLLVTTRDGGIVKRLGANDCALDILTDEQALALLAEWSEQAVETLPDEAETAAGECGNLPLALAMIGASVRGRPSRWGNVLHRLQSADLDRIRQEFPDYPYPNLMRAIEVSVEALDPTDAVESQARARYADLAVFPEDTPIPEASLRTYWNPCGLDEFDTQDVIDCWVDRSLAGRDQQGRLNLHDLQLDYVKKKAGDLKALHHQLLDAYAALCPDGWSTGPDDGYFFQQLPYHLSSADKQDDLRGLLLDFWWLNGKLAATKDVNVLITDFDCLDAGTAGRLVQGAIRLSAHVLAKDPSQLASQLLGRLLGMDDAVVAQLLAQAKDIGGSWLRPLNAALTPPGGPLIRTLDGHAGVVGVAVSDDGRTAVSASRDDTLKVWDLRSGTLQHTLEGHTNMVHSVAVSGDGRTAVSASDDRTLKVWDLRSGTLQHTLEGHTSWVRAVAVSGDGRTAVSASDDRTLKVWDLRSGTLQHTLEGHRDAVRGVAVSGDGRTAVSASEDRTLKVWDLRSGTLQHTLEGHRDAVHGVAVSGDGRTAVSASGDCTLKVWDLRTGTLQHTLEGHRDAVGGVAVSGDGRTAVSASDDRTLKVWDLRSGTLQHTLEGYTGAVRGVAVSGDGRTAVSTAEGRTLKVWDLRSGTLQRPLEGHTDGVNGVAVSGDGRTAVSASEDRTLKVWDLRSGTLQHTLEGHRDAVRGVAVSGDGRTAVSTAEDRTLKVWDLRSGTLQHTLEGHTSWVRAVAVSGDGRTAVSTAEDRTLKAWDLRSGTLQHTLEGHTDAVNGVAVSGDGRTAVSASWDDTLKVWDLRSGTLQHTLEGHTDAVNGVAVSGDGRTAVSASWDDTLKVWDLRSGTLQHTLEGHTDGVNGVAVSGDGRTAVSASDDRTLKVWDLRSGTLQHTLEGHRDAVRGVAVSGDGRTAVSASEDRTLKVWDISTGAVVATYTADGVLFTCALAPDDLTIVSGDTLGRMHFVKLEYTSA